MSPLAIITTIAVTVIVLLLLKRWARVRDWHWLWFVFWRVWVATLWRGFWRGVLVLILIVTVAHHEDARSWTTFLPRIAMLNTNPSDAQAIAVLVFLGFNAFAFLSLFFIRTVQVAPHQAHYYIYRPFGIRWHWLFVLARWWYPFAKDMTDTYQDPGLVRGRAMIPYQEAWRRLRMKSAGLWARCTYTLYRFWRFCTWPVRWTWAVLTWPFRAATKRLSRGVPSGEPSHNKARSAAHRAAKGGALTLYWGMVDLPMSEAPTHFLVTGSVGSGKTITIQLLMQSVLKYLGQGLDHRALIFDGKRDVISFLTKLGLDCPWRTLNPFDKRCVPWHMAADVHSPAAAWQVASILIPAEEGTSQPFFTDASRQLLHGVFLSFIKNAPGQWTLRQVLLTIKSPERLLKVLQQTVEGRDIANSYSTEQRTFSNILSTLATKLQPLEIVAALWDRSKEKPLSLEAWIKDESILILGNHPAHQAALAPINQAIFRRLADLILSQSESQTRRTWFILDEVREAGRLDGLASLLLQGRSKGACVVLGFQDIEGMRGVYGEKFANEITGMCNNRTFLRTDSQPTAMWAEQHFGTALRAEPRTSTTSGSASQGSQTTFSGSTSSHTEYVVRDVLMASELMSFPKTCLEHGLRGVHDIPLVGSYSTHISLKWIEDRLPKRDGERDALLNDQPRSSDEQYLKPWEDSDARVLIKAPATQASPASPNPLNQGKAP